MREFVIGLVSDLHFGKAAGFGGKLRKLSHQAPELTRAFVRAMNERVRPDLVVNLGDDIEDEGPEADLARYSECMAILGELDAPRLHVAGNHDVVHLGPRQLMAAWGLEGTPIQRPEAHGDALYYATDMGGYHLVVLHTHERKDLDVSVDAEQLAWLEEDLARTPLPTLIFMHHSAAEQSLRDNRWFEGSPHICLVRERRKLRRLFEEQGRVLAVFNGHLHWNHLDVIGTIPYVTLQSLIENVDDDAPGRAAAAHAIVRISAKHVNVECAGAERARYQFSRK